MKGLDHLSVVMPPDIKGDNSTINLYIHSLHAELVWFVSEASIAQEKLISPYPCEIVGEESRVEMPWKNNKSEFDSTNKCLSLNREGY